MIAIESVLRQYRKELSPKVTQERIARQVGISLQWYRQIENHPEQPTSYTTANALLRAINTERQARNLEALALDQLNLKIV
jgi:DNA-binding XRE family transcriptional regulator